MTSTNIVSATLRIICGLALIIFSYLTYQRTRQHAAAGEPMQIFGATVGASPGQLSFGLIVIGVIGILLIVLGIVTLLKKRA
jgi:hypothetical protein